MGQKYKGMKEEEEKTVRMDVTSDEKEDIGEYRTGQSADDIHGERTLSLQEYERRKQKDGMTVRLTDAGGLQEKLDPVAVVLSEDAYRIQRNEEEKVFFRNDQGAAADFADQRTLFPEKKRLQEWKEDAHYLRKTAAWCPVGWLVCVEGPDFGKSFPLKEGKNSIGRSEMMDVSLTNDRAVSRVEHAWIEYIEAECRFLAYTGEARKMVYVNDHFLLRSEEMNKNDVLFLGDSGLMLIPCCDKEFSWKSLEKEKKQST